MNYQDELIKIKKEILHDMPFLTIKAGTMMPSLSGYYELAEDIDVPMLIEDFTADLKRIDQDEALDLEKVFKAMGILLGVDPEFKYRNRYINMIQKAKSNVQSYLIHLINFSDGHEEYALMAALALLSLEESARNYFVLGNTLENLSISLSKKGYSDRMKVFFDESIKFYHKSADKDVQFSLPMYKLGYYYKSKGEFLRAKDYWERFIASDQDPLRIEEIRNELEILEKLVDYEIGYKFVREGRIEEGLDLLLPLVALFPTWWNLMFVIGLAFRLSGEYAAAVDYFKKVISLKSEQVEAMNELAFCYMHLEKFAQAKEILDAALTIDPTHIDMLANRGVVHFYLEDLVNAMKDVDSALSIDPEYELAVMTKKEIEKLLKK
jgi:tetratricopeptide (TPR) repeat protein